MKISEAIIKMIEFYSGSINDITHFLKVYGYAKTIAEVECTDSDTQYIIELAAVVHDIACPLCRQKYGNAAGNLQEIESPALLETFFEHSDIGNNVKERVISLVSRHHTYTDVLGVDHQILLEADFLVNAEKLANNKEKIEEFCNNVFKTETGTALLKSIYLRS